MLVFLLSPPLSKSSRKEAIFLMAYIRDKDEGRNFHTN